jgi:NAD(P)-dependent dehydrogenase (short-subunit alcohol dehydrogenase family)
MWRLVFYLDQQGAELVAERLRDSGAAVLVNPVDIEDKAVAKNVIAVTEHEFGAADLLCSGMGIAVGMGECAPAVISERAWSVNVLGPVTRSGLRKGPS